MPQRRYAFLFIVQQGELELKALLLAASLKRFLRCDYELIAALPDPVERWGRPDESTLAALRDLDVRTVPITNPISNDYPIGNKIACLGVPTDADKLIFLDSDIIALREFYDQARFQFPFSAKPADRQTFSTDETVWRHAYEAAGAPFPSMRFPSSVSGEFGPPYFNSGFVAVDPAVRLAETWQECCHRVNSDVPLGNKAVWLDQIGLPLAVARLGLAYDCLDERYNYPAHLKPLDAAQLPYFCHYHTAQVFAREPALSELLVSFAEQYPAIAKAVAANPDWHAITSIPGSSAGLRSPSKPASGPYVAAAPRANLIITGIPRSGTSYLCNLLHRYSNCVIVNEPTQIFTPLIVESVPWGVARFYAQLRSAIRDGRPIANKLRNGKIVHDTFEQDGHATYTPQVDNIDFILGTKNTLTYLPRLADLRRAMPEARIVVCVRNPFDTVASWKTSFPHLRDAALNKLPVGHPADPCLTGRQATDLKRISEVPVVALRRATWWSYLAESVLEQGHTVILVRYADLVERPHLVLAEILDGWCKGRLLEEIEPSTMRCKREQLDAADEEAIGACCSEAAAALGVADGNTV